MINTTIILKAEPILCLVSPVIIEGQTLRQITKVNKLKIAISLKISLILSFAY